MHRIEPTGGVRPNARENDQIRPSNTAWAAWNAGRASNFGCQPIQKTPIIHVSSGFIRGIPVVIEMSFERRRKFLLPSCSS
jgi:hypothetical protein